MRNVSIALLLAAFCFSPLTLFAQRLIVTPQDMTVQEGESVAFTVALSTEPAAHVTVSILRSDETKIGLDKTELIFTPSNWSTGQLVTLTAAEDEDMVDDSGRLVLVASGGGYDGNGGIIVTPKAPQIDRIEAPGESVQLEAAVLDQDGLATTGLTFDWSSSDPSVAVVDSTGMVTAVDFGVTTISATLATITGTATILVGNAPLTDRVILEQLFRATAGVNWTRREGWLTSAPLDEWYGVTTEAGRVVQLDLKGNDLKGRLPKVIAGLSELRYLDFGYDWPAYNRLWGSIPPEWGNLTKLKHLNLQSNDLSGPIPSELRRLVRLQKLYLRYTGLEGPMPAWLGELTALTELALDGNYFESRIPPELGNLHNLEILYLSESELYGELPPELGKLTRLRTLFAPRNWFTGSIPRQWKSMTSLTRLFLASSNLSGEIPPELGSLTNLDDLGLDFNNLTGPIPSTLSNLVNLRALNLGWNKLNGNLPSEIGQLSNLEYLNLSSNRFEGGIPSEWGGLSSLQVLLLGQNPGLAGAIPRELTRLDVQGLDVEQTALCAPFGDAEFTQWFDRMEEGYAEPCGQSIANDAYIVQATQSRNGRVPLVAGRKALLRAFVTAGDNVEQFPDVQAQFYLAGTLEQVLDIPGKPGPVPQEVGESDASQSVNAIVPGWLIQPGLEMVIDVDPNGTLANTVDIVRRIPSEGRLQANVTELPTMDLTVIPWIWPQDPDEEIVDLTDDLSPSSDVLSDTRDLLPVGDLDVTLHAPVYTTSRSGFNILDETEALRVMEGGTGYYLGLTSRHDVQVGVAGVAWRDGWAAWSWFNSGVIAHELGHNMSLGHAPCGVNGDPLYPEPDGKVGSFGFDIETGPKSVIAPNISDFMSYCGPTWVGEWHFKRMVRHRLRREKNMDRSVVSGKALLVWGGRDENGELFLNPAFLVHASNEPPSDGPYELTGRSAISEQLFTVRFDLLKTGNGDGREGFAFALPADPDWRNLAEISLRGPEGASAVLDNKSDRTSAIIRDAATGEVRAMLIDVPAVTMKENYDKAISTLAGARFVEARSYGLPDPADWSTTDEVSTAATSTGVGAVTVDPRISVVALGDTVRLAAKARDIEGAVMKDIKFDWTSSDTLVAVVEQAGLITALRPGFVTIMATADGVQGTADVQIERRSDSIMLTPVAATVAAGGTVQFVATVQDAQGIPRKDVALTWSSSNTSVAWVNSRGLAFGWRAGKAIVTVQADRDLSASAEVTVEGSLEAERFALTRFYARLRGEQWADSRNWLTDAPLDQWYGVTVDAQSGRVTELSLGRNNLRGELGPELGLLAELKALSLGGNTIRGQIPPEIWQLRQLLSLDISSTGLTGQLSPEIGNLSHLNDLFLSDNGLTGPLPSTLGDMQELRFLDLSGNLFEGNIPEQIGNLEHLTSINLTHNRLSGAIPASLMANEKLFYLSLSHNKLSAIPASLPEIDHLQEIDLSHNQVRAIPASLAKLRKLHTLNLSHNQVSEIPPSLAENNDLQYLNLSHNQLAGHISASVGELGKLSRLFLNNNQLSGNLPAALSQLDFLAEIHLQNNTALQGALPSEWVERNQTVQVQARGTGVCAPRNPGARDWLRSNDLTYIPFCSEDVAVFAYLVQSIQSREYPTPLIANEAALLRIFISANGDATMPAVRASFHKDGQLVHSGTVPTGVTPIPAKIDEGDLSKSVNMVVPGSVIQPGLEMVLEIDPGGTLDPALGIPRRIPTQGRTQLDVQAVPDLDLTAIPFLLVDNPDSTLVEAVNDIETDPGLFQKVDQILPIDEIALTVHEPILTTTSTDATEILHETEAIRVIEGSDGYYMGVYRHIRDGILGQAASIGGRSFVTLAHNGVLAHEVGHAMNLFHTWCNVRGDDPNYPWRDGRTGSWGYNFATGELVEPEATDVMGYCGRQWISGYHFQRALDHRLRTESDTEPNRIAQPVLLVWGGVDATGQPYLKPSFIVDAPPKLPTKGGDHQLTVSTDGGQAVASLTFDMPRTAHAEGRSVFVFAIPVPDGLSGVIEHITLNGPGGSATLDSENSQTTILILDPDSGKVRGLLTDPTPSMVMQLTDDLDSPFPGFEVVTSSGLPEVQYERR